MSNELTCSVPPALTDDELTAYLKGEAENHIEEHLEKCAFCRARLDDMQFGNRLVSVLYRFDCPDSQKLTDYALEHLPAYERDAIQKHLEFCLSCQEEITILQSFLALSDEFSEPFPETHSIQPKRRHPKDYVARVAQLPTATALRGKLHGPILASISDKLSVFLEFDESIQATTLKGQIVAGDLDDLAVWESAIVAVFHNLNLIATTTVNESGAFQCEVDAIVPVQIRITAPSGEAISIPELMLDEDT